MTELVLGWFIILWFLVMPVIVDLFIPPIIYILGWTNERET